MHSYSTFQLAFYCPLLREILNGPGRNKLLFLKREGGCAYRQHRFYVVYTLHEKTDSQDWLFRSDTGPFNQALSCETVQEKSVHDC